MVWNRSSRFAICCTRPWRFESFYGHVDLATGELARHFFERGSFWRTVSSRCPVLIPRLLQLVAGSTRPLRAVARHPRAQRVLLSSVGVVVVDLRVSRDSIIERVEMFFMGFGWRSRQGGAVVCSLSSCLSEVSSQPHEVGTIPRRCGLAFSGVTDGAQRGRLAAPATPSSAVI